MARGGGGQAPNDPREVRPIDPPTFLTVPLILPAVAALVSWLPARRATSMGPAEGLREN
jgi:ABC-type lipoprotein release transport system permease subunit